MELQLWNYELTLVLNNLSSFFFAVLLWLFESFVLGSLMSWPLTIQNMWDAVLNMYSNLPFSSEVTDRNLFDNISNIFFLSN